MTKSRTFGPINSTERIAFMDSLRGFAVFGIFLVNMSMMAAPSMAYGYELGLYGKVLPLSQILIVCEFFSLQCLISLFWLRHFPMGPLEWVLRKVTYWR